MNQDVAVRNRDSTADSRFMRAIENLKWDKRSTPGEQESLVKELLENFKERKEYKF